MGVDGGASELRHAIGDAAKCWTEPSQVFSGVTLESIGLRKPVKESAAISLE